MTADATTAGRRRPNGTLPWELAAGDYCLRGTVWWVRLPSEAGPFPLNDPRSETTWMVVEHDDGSISASPSLFDGEPGGWHGFLEAGLWRSVR